MLNDCIILPALVNWLGLSDEIDDLGKFPISLSLYGYATRNDGSRPIKKPLEKLYQAIIFSADI